MRTQPRLSRVLAAGAMALALLLSACSGGALDAGGGGEDDGPIKIGLMLPLSGILSSSAEDMQAAFELYLEENDNQIGGREVELIVEDTEALPDVGLRVANKLILEDEVDVAAGIVSSAVALQVAPAFADAEIPLVVSNAVADAITGEAGSEFVFRTAQSSYQLGLPAGQWLWDEFGDVPLFLMAPDYSAGEEILAGVEEGFTEAGGTIAGKVLPPFQTTQDYQPFLSQARSSGADVIYAFFAAGEAATFVQQYEDFGLKGQIPLVGPGSLTSPDVAEAQGTSAEGAYAILPYTWTMDTERNNAFVESYEESTGRKPSYYGVFSYDSAQLIAHAVEATDGDVSDGAALAAAMEGAEIDSPRGALTIDPDNHGTVQTFYATQMRMQEGELAPVVVADLGVFGEQPE